MSFDRDIHSVGKPRPCHDPKGRRPIWSGPIPDRYYYIVRNVQVSPGSWMVYRSDIRDDIRLIANIQGGHRSLVELTTPLFLIPSEGKLLAHGKVDQVKQSLWESMDRKLTLLDPAGEERVRVKGRKIEDEELFI